MKNPCKSCPSGHLSKNNPVCKDCEDRIAYVRHIQNPDYEMADMAEGGRTHAAPDVVPNVSSYLSGRAVQNIKEGPVETTKTETETKSCYACKQDRPLSEYHKNRTNPDGLQHECKACKNKEARRYRRGHQLEIRFFIDGEFKYAWLTEECEIRRKFARPSKRKVWKGHKPVSKTRKKQLKKMGLDLDQTAVLYMPNWNSPRTLRSHLEKTCEHIELNSIDMVLE